MNAADGHQARAPASASAAISSSDIPRISRSTRSLSRPTESALSGITGSLRDRESRDDSIVVVGVDAVRDLDVVPARAVQLRIREQARHVERLVRGDAPLLQRGDHLRRLALLGPAGQRRVDHGGVFAAIDEILAPDQLAECRHCASVSTAIATQRPSPFAA